MRTRLEQSNAQLAEMKRDQVALTQRAAQLENQTRSQGEVHAILEQRVENLRRENDRLAGELASNLLTASGERGTPGNAILQTSGVGSGASDLPEDLRKKLREFAGTHDDVKFIPDKRMLRFQTHTAFVDSSDRMTSQARAALVELAKIMNSRAAKDWDYSVVGHTFAQSQVSNELTPLHATDWHLAAHQAIAVVRYLEEQGVPPSRFTVMSYGSQQPVDLKDDDVARKNNARLEVFFSPGVK